MGLIILLIPLALLWFMVSRGRRQQRELMAQQDSVTPGTRVMTTSGLYAQVAEVDGDAVVLEIAPGVLTRWSRRAIGQVLPATDAKPDDSEDETDATDQVIDSDADSGDADPDREAIRSEAGHTGSADSDSTDGSTGTDGR